MAESSAADLRREIMGLAYHFWAKKGRSFSAYAEIMGVLEGCKIDLHRQQAEQEASAARVRYFGDERD